MYLCCLCASKLAPEGQLRLQLAPILRTSRREWVLVRVSRPRSTRQFSGLCFCPSRASSQCFSQAPGASRSQNPMSSFLLSKYGHCNAAGCANTNEHRPRNTRSCFSAPKAVLNEVEQRSDCAQAQTHMYPSLVGGFYPHPEPNSSPPSPKSYPLNR